MRRLFLSVGLILITSFLIGSALGQNISVTGIVTDTDGEPLVGATVTLDNTLQGVATTTNGSYTMPIGREGSYSITASFVGYQSQTKEIQVNASKEVDFTLSPQSVMGEEVIVRGTRSSSRMPIAYTDLNREEVQARNSGFDIPYLLELTPSVVAISEGGSGVGNTQFRIRGTDMTRINVTVNGIPINDSESQGVWWVNMPDFVSSVDNVQIQRGVGTSTNGAAAFGATVNFQTVPLTSEPFASAEAMYGSFNTLRSALRGGTGLINESFSFEGRYSRVTSDGYIERGTSDHQSMFFTGAWHTPKSILRFNLIYGDQKTGITWNGTPSYMLDDNRRYNPSGLMFTDDEGVEHYYDNQTDNYSQTHYQLIFGHKLTPNLTLNTTAHLTAGAGYYEQYRANQSLSSYGIDPFTIGEETISRTNLVRQKWLDNYFYGAVASLAYTQNTVETILGGGWNRYDGDHFGYILWSERNLGLPKNYEWYNNNGLKDDMNAYTKVLWQVLPNIAVFADIQGRYISYTLSGSDDDLVSLDQAHDWSFINPKGGLTYTISPKHEVFASVAMANREPSRADIKDAMKYDAQDTPSHETLVDYEVGYTFSSPLAAFGVNLYYMDYTDQLVHTGKLSSSGYALMTNVPTSYRRGIELTGGIKPASWLRWDANLTLSQNIIEDYTDYVNLYNADWNLIGQREEHIGQTDISFSPSVVGSSILRLEPYQSIGLSFISKYVGSQYYDNTSSTDRMLDPYFVQNVKLDYTLSAARLDGVRVEFMVNNLLNNEYVANAWVWRAAFNDGSADYYEDGLFPQAGINFMLRLGLDF